MKEKDVWSQSTEFFLLYSMKKDGSGGNLTSLNYYLESKKFWLLRCTINWEWSSKKIK